MRYSIITISYNSGTTIERTIKSVLAQTVKDYEYIIIDGGSIDETLDIVKKYEPLFEGRMKWKSEPDNGIYSAMNKGIERSMGEIIGICNSDDWLVDNTLEILDSYIEANHIDVRSEVVLTGWMRFHYVEGSSVVMKRSYDEFVKGLKWYIMKMIHPATWVSRSAYDKVGFFDENLRISADFDMMSRLYKSEVKFFFIEQILTNMSDGGVSNSHKTWLGEKNYMLKKNNEPFYTRWKILVYHWLTSRVKRLLPSIIIKSYRKRKSGR